MSKVLHTKLCDILGIEYPILQASMATNWGCKKFPKAIASPELVAAVSNAGGLGVLATIQFDAERIRSTIRDTRRLTNKPFGINLSFAKGFPSSTEELLKRIPPEYVAFMDKLKKELGIADIKDEKREGPNSHYYTMGLKRMYEGLEVMIEEEVPVLVCALSPPDPPVVQRLHSKGIKIVSAVGRAKDARTAVNGGVDVVISTGYEAGAHSGTIGLMSLLPAVINEVHPTPVVAAGGIVTGRQIAAALAMGASGVWCGTRFAASQEAAVDDWFKEKLLKARAEDTRHSRYFTGMPCRHLRDAWDEAWERSGMKPLSMPEQGALTADAMYAAQLAGQHDYLWIGAGQGVGMVNEIKPAKQIMEDLVSEAIECLEEMPRRVTFSK